MNLFLDSGAFSAWSQDKEIDITDYIDFIKDNEEFIEIYANLDVIGDAGGTWKNQMTMQKAGLNPVPVFHYGEDEKWLQRYLRKGYEYIALGGMVPISNEPLKMWLDRIFKRYLCDDEGMPTIKVHGFGLTSVELMLRYPWWSVDSTSWVITGRMGSVYVPYYRVATGWQYKMTPMKIAVSNRSPGVKEKDKHLNTMSVGEKLVVLDYFADKGYDIGRSAFKKVKQDYELKSNERWAEKKPKSTKKRREVEIIIEPGLCNTYQLRDQLNIQYFKDLEKHSPKWPWPLKIKDIQDGFF